MKIFLSLALLIVLKAPAYAVEIGNGYYYGGSNNYIVEGGKAYKINSSYNDDYSKRTVTIEKYDFPSLTYIGSLNAIDEGNSYTNSIQVDGSGLLISSVEYGNGTDTENDDGSITVTAIDTYTTRSYDASLNLVAEKVSEDTYTFTYYPYYYDGSVECKDLPSVKRVAAKAKKKGGKKGGIQSCSKIRTISHKVIR